jgi:hypothetical protein
MQMLRYQGEFLWTISSGNICRQIICRRISMKLWRELHNKTMKVAHWISAEFVDCGEICEKDVIRLFHALVCPFKYLIGRILGAKPTWYQDLWEKLWCVLDASWCSHSHLQLIASVSYFPAHRQFLMRYMLFQPVYTAPSHSYWFR